MTTGNDAAQAETIIVEMLSGRALAMLKRTRHLVDEIVALHSSNKRANVVNHATLNGPARKSKAVKSDDALDRELTVGLCTTKSIYSDTIRSMVNTKSR